MSWGGSRPGAGRKAAAVYKKTIAFRVTDDTAERYRALKGAGVDVREEFELLLRKLSKMVTGE